MENYAGLDVSLAHFRLGCDSSPILLESKENGRCPIRSLIRMNGVQSRIC